MRNPKPETRNPNQAQMSKTRNSPVTAIMGLRVWSFIRISGFGIRVSPQGHVFLKPTAIFVPLTIDHHNRSNEMGPVGPAFAAGFGAMAALLLIGGAVLLRWQRTRLQFSLMQSALEKGTTPLLGNVPLWLLSFRQGAMIFVLGA